MEYATQCMNMCVVNTRYSADSDGLVLPATLWRPGRLVLCLYMFRAVILRSAGLQALPVAFSEVQIRALVQIFPGDGGTPAQRGLRALGGRDRKDRLTVL
jgi:hypothetical protein